jgi:hypothetical protein
MSWMDVPGDKLLEPLVDMVRSVLFETYSIVFSLCIMPCRARNSRLPHWPKADRILEMAGKNKFELPSKKNGR